MISPRYDVGWIAEVAEDLGVYWSTLDSQERDRLTRLLYEIDERLSSFPESKGELIDQEGSLRSWKIPDRVPGARVVFAVVPELRKVRVSTLTLYGRRHT